MLLRSLMRRKPCDAGGSPSKDSRKLEPEWLQHVHVLGCVSSDFWGSKFGTCAGAFKICVGTGGCPRLALSQMLSQKNITKPITNAIYHKCYVYIYISVLCAKTWLRVSQTKILVFWWCHAEPSPFALTRALVWNRCNRGSYGELFEPKYCRQIFYISFVLAFWRFGVLAFWRFGVEKCWKGLKNCWVY